MFKPIGKTIYCVSDIHLEFGDYGQVLLEKFPKADILVLAGDIGSVVFGLDKIKKFLVSAKEKYSDIVFIAGNHEFYSCNYNRKGIIDDLRGIAEETKTHFLHRESKVIQDIEFIGTTLWSMIDEAAFKSMNDWRQNVFRSQLEYVCEFVDDFRFLEKHLESPSKYPRIVITHHVPTVRLRHKRFEDAIANSGFYTNILDSVVMRGVAYWFCGHTHEHATAKYQDTLCVVNPVGYPAEYRQTRLSLQTYPI